MQQHVPAAEAEEIDLRVCSLDLDDLDADHLPVSDKRPARRAIPADQEGAGWVAGPWYMLDADEEAYDLATDVVVVWLAPDQVQLVHPASLTPFGPCGGVLNLGDVVEVVDLQDGTFGYRRLLQRNRVWSRTLADPGRETADNTSVRTLLQELTAAGCGWDWCACNLTVQAPLEEGQTEPAGPVVELVEVLGQVLEELKAESGGVPWFLRSEDS
jgi:hypothetical protein